MKNLVSAVVVFDDWFGACGWVAGTSLQPRITEGMGKTAGGKSPTSTTQSHPLNQS
jgi:hypothetical protein